MDNVFYKGIYDTVLFVMQLSTAVCIYFKCSVLQSLYTETVYTVSHKYV